MIKKLMTIFALMTACMMVLFVSAAACAEDAPNGYDGLINEEDLVEIEDDWGYISREVIEQHTPEMTQEFIHADDPDWQPEGEAEEPASEEAEPVEHAEPETQPEAEAQPEPEQEEAQEPEVNEAPAEEETAPAEVTEETEKTEEPAGETEEETAGKAEETEQTEQPEEAEKTEETEQAEGTEEVTEEPEENEEEVTEEEAAKVTVRVTASMRSENLMHLKAHVDGPEGNEYDYQWQVSVDGGENYEDLEDQNEDFMDVELDEENASNLWRVRVHAV